MFRKSHVLMFILTFVGPLPALLADDPVRDGDWMTHRDEALRLTVQTREMTLHPQGEPRPALKHQFITDEFNLIDENAAIYYLKAMGFLEQNGARQKLAEIWAAAAKTAEEKGDAVGEVAPYVWQNMAPKDLPIEEVKQYLQWTSFQPPLLAEAAKRRRFTLDRNFRNADDPIAYLLPEIQQMRELARNQRLRCRIAIAEGRIEDAIKILGQQFAMARHLGNDEVLISNLVGVVVAQIACEDLLHLLELPDAPNLYWAIAQLPRPLVGLQNGMSLERNLLFQQVKPFGEVDERPRPAGYWQDFVDRAYPALEGLASLVGHVPSLDDKELERARFVLMIAAAYPNARRFLIEECGMTEAMIESLPRTQTVMLATRRFYEHARDDSFKLGFVDFYHAQSHPQLFDVEASLKKSAARAGWIAEPSEMLLPAIAGIRSAQQRSNQMLCLAQVIEAMRMHAAQHAGQLPMQLDALPVPAPFDSVSGKSFEYTAQGDRALLVTQPSRSLQTRIILKIAKP